MPKKAGEASMRKRKLASEANSARPGVDRGPRYSPPGPGSFGLIAPENKLPLGFTPNRTKTFQPELDWSPFHLCSTLPRGESLAII